MTDKKQRFVLLFLQRAWGVGPAISLGLLESDRSAVSAGVSGDGEAGPWIDRFPSHSLCEDSDGRSFCLHVGASPKLSHSRERQSR